MNTQPYLYRMPVGIAGAISRYHDLTVEPVLLRSDNSFLSYGLVGKYEGDYFVPLAEGDKADVIQGVYVRPYPTTETGDFVRQVGKEKNFPGDALKRGYMTVTVADASTIKKGAKVFVRVKATDTEPLGSFSNTLIADETVELPNAQFTGSGDASGNAEISYKI
ncbi:MAG: structural cement protein Gp24 [Providencia sp.]|uniref:structural cement protein Gp24 n=1 Tax=Providencia sp. TaxID=589 RepID=UPI003F98048E